MDTPTTDPGSFLSSVDNLTSSSKNDSPIGKVKAVVSKLVENWRQLISSESNVDLFAKLLKRHISTRDIYFFLKKQAMHKKVHKELDQPLSRKAMRSKLNDACAFSIRQRRVVNRLKSDLLKATGYKRYKQRKIIAQIKSAPRLQKP